MLVEPGRSQSEWITKVLLSLQLRHSSIHQQPVYIICCKALRRRVRNDHSKAMSLSLGGWGHDPIFELHFYLNWIAVSCPV